MGSLNKVMLICRLGSAPEKRVTQSGASVVSFSAATSESYKDQQGNKQEKTTWHKIVLWSKLADLAEKYLKKGSNIYIEGSLSNSDWTDKDGNKRNTVEIVGRELKFMDSKSNSIEQPNNDQKNNGGKQNNNAEVDIDRDDIPF